MKPRPAPVREIYRDFIIDLSDWVGWQAVHVDYDGAEDANDNRFFFGKTRAEIVEQIDEWHQEQGPEPFLLPLLAAAAFWLAVLAGIVWFAVYAVRNGGLQ